MILHPQNLQNWCVFIPTFYPFRCGTGPSHLFDPFWGTLAPFFSRMVFLARNVLLGHERLQWFQTPDMFLSRLETVWKKVGTAFPGCSQSVFLKLGQLRKLPRQSIIWPLVWHSFWHPSRVRLRAQVCPVGSGPAGPSCIQSSGPAVLHRVPSCAQSSQKGFGPLPCRGAEGTQR